MLRNKEMKWFVFGESLILLFTVFLILIFNMLTFNQYKVNLIENNGYLISSFLKKHPELEEEVINTIISKTGDTEKGIAILEQYGLADIDNLDYIKDIRNLKNKMILYNLLLALLIFSLLSSIYYIFIHRQYQKIREINQYMLAILNGDYHFDIKDYEEGEISNLKNDIYRITNVLKQQSENAKDGKKELETVLSDISHQLKTPLTSMYVMNDLLYDDTMDPKIRKEFLQKNRNQLERIEWLVTSLLKISRLDSGTIVLKKEKVSIRELIQKAIEPIRIPLELKKQNVVIKGDPNTHAILDFNWTVEAILNILKNAHEHSPEEGNIEIHYEENALYVAIYIQDHGEGIDEKDIRHIFKRFYKGSSSKESIGIGLNMAYHIITKQNGDIKVNSEKGKGTLFTIHFYKNIV